MATVIEMDQARNCLERLVNLAGSGEEVVLTNQGAPVARIVAPTSAAIGTPRTPDLHPGAIWTSDDFDEPLPDSFWLGNES